jgi:hypothetical protein
VTPASTPAEAITMETVDISIIAANTLAAKNKIVLIWVGYNFSATSLKLVG